MAKAEGYIDVTLSVEAEGDQYVSVCPELGTSSCGDTPQEALHNLQEAIVLYLNGLEEVGTRERVFRELGIVMLSSPRPSEPTRLSFQTPIPVTARA